MCSLSLIITLNFMISKVVYWLRARNEFSAHAQKIGPGQRLSDLGAEQKKRCLWEPEWRKPYYGGSNKQIATWILDFEWCPSLVFFRVTHDGLSKRGTACGRHKFNKMLIMPMFKVLSSVFPRSLSRFQISPASVWTEDKHCFKFLRR